MQKSFVAKTTINFVDFEFYVRPGDLLVHDTSNHNRLTVYRNGQIVKVVKQEPLGIVAFLKNKFIEEVSDTAPAPAKTVESKPSIKPSKEDPALKRRVPHVGTTHHEPKTETPEPIVEK